MGAADSRSDLIERNELRAGKAVSSLERRLEQLPDSHPASPRYARGDCFYSTDSLGIALRSNARRIVLHRGMLLKISAI